MTDPHPQKRAAFEPAERLLRPTGYNPTMKRPTSTVAGAALVLLRVVAGVFLMAEIALNGAEIAPETLSGLGSPAAVSAAIAGILALIGAVLIADVIFAVLILKGRNWPRVIVMVFAVISISSAFAAWWAEDLEITLKTSLLSTGVDVLVLLALSSRSAAAYARRNERR